MSLAYKRRKKNIKRTKAVIRAAGTEYLEEQQLIQEAGTRMPLVPRESLRYLITRHLGV